MKMLQLSSMPKKNSYTTCIRILSYFIVFVLLCHETDAYSLAKHMEVDKIEHSCPELDSCNYKNESELLSPVIQRNCACDIECNKFDDCCIDAPKSSVKKSDMECYDVKGFGGVYMIGACPDVYDGDESWRDLCNKMEIPDASDPIGSVPVTDYDTGVTYKNVYCKLCNGKFHVMNFWKTKLNCPFLSSFNESHSITDNYILRNLVRKGKKWGLNLETTNGMFFLECKIETTMPPAFQNKIRRCIPDLISDCSPFWENELIRNKCKSFLGPRFTDDDYGYRNVYCAICNDVDTSDLICQSPQAESQKLFRFTAYSSFALLLDVNIKRGEKVGLIRLCKSGEVYDPFFKKCRELQCLPGFVRRGRKCFPRRTVNRSATRKPAKYRRAYLSSNKPYSSTTSVAITTESPKIVSYAKEQNISYYEARLYKTSVSVDTKN